MRRSGMESEYLKKLQVLFQQYRYVLIYGAGGVTRALLSLLEPYLNKDKTYIVVSDKREEENLIEGYPIKEISEFHGICNEVYVMISAMPRYIQEMEQHLRNVGFTAYCTVEYLLRQLYGEIWKNEIEKRKIIFANGDGYGFGGNPKYIALKLLSHNKNLDLVWITSRKDAEFPENVLQIFLLPSHILLHFFHFHPESPHSWPFPLSGNTFRFFSAPSGSPHRNNQSCL